MISTTKVSARPSKTALGITHASLGQLATDSLRSAILRGQYQPGERLVEDRLSIEMGVSRVPIREALRQLATEGLVTVQPRRGASVAEVSPAVAADLVEVRATLEGLNARLAARNRSTEILAELHDILREGNLAAESQSVTELVRLNGSFHDKLAEAGRNSILWDIMRTLRERTSLVFALTTQRRASEDWKEHSRILAAVIKGNEEQAANLAAEHVRAAAQATLAAKKALVAKSR
jgi:DNA-binding GntR family transcriptional regulator